jgi:hypothetical protein
MACVATGGFIDALPSDQHATLEIALAGLYKRAGVDIVREQVAALLGPGIAYDIGGEGLVVWPGTGYQTEVVYALDGTGSVAGVVRGEPLAEPPVALDTERLLFSRQRVLWSAWVDAFREDRDSSPSVTRVIYGPSLLARRPAPPHEDGGSTTLEEASIR